MKGDKPTMTDKRASFGPGGNSESFYASGKKSTADAPAWLSERGLDAYEYQAGNGLTAGAAALKRVGDEAARHGIKMSLHAPYYISLSGVDPEKRLKSISYIKSSLDASILLGADTIVVHCGSASKIDREEAMALATDTLCRTLEELDREEYRAIHIGIETMGKRNQLGTLDEVIRLCKLSPRLRPVVDFGHLNARDCGHVFESAADYGSVFDKIANELGDEVASSLHCHFSRIEWTGAGEKKHLTFADTEYGPDHAPLMRAIFEREYAPRIICESAGTMAEDALEMKRVYEALYTSKGE